MPSKSIFLIGPGFLGWTLLETLSSTGFDDITTLVRREEHGEAIRKITSDKIKIVFGGLNDTNLITQVVAEHDIIFHTATADHLPSANAVLKGIGKRSEEGLKTIYSMMTSVPLQSIHLQLAVHTSGASLLDDRSISAFKSSITFTDTDPTAIDALDIKQPHREIDLAIATFSRKQEGNNVKIAIMIREQHHLHHSTFLYTS